MSEFECACGNLIRPSVGYCEVCGGRAVRMDGYSRSELIAMERHERECEKQEENEDDCWQARNRRS